MKISVVTISYNQAKYLRQCIESVLTQDYLDLEYIVVDPGSTDGSREIIESYGDRIVRVFEKDDGPADGLNKGFRHATGEVFGYLNADDRLLPHALWKVVRLFQKHRIRADIVLGHGYRIDDKGHRVEKLYCTTWSPRLYAYGIANAVQQATFFLAQSFRRAGGFNTNNKTCWDGELLVDMTLAGAKIVISNEILGEFRIHPESITGSARFNTQRIREHRRIAEKILGREPTLLDWLLSLALRAYKALRYPDRTLYKATSRVRRSFRRALR